MLAIFPVLIENTVCHAPPSHSTVLEGMQDTSMGKAAACSNTFLVTPGSLQLGIQTFASFAYCSGKQQKERCDYPQKHVCISCLMTSSNWSRKQQKQRVLLLLATETAQSLYI